MANDEITQSQNDLDGYEVLKLGNQLCFPLYACSREIVKKYTPFLNEIGLTYTQYITMMVLWEHQEVTAKKLGECLRLDSGTLTPLLKKLESQGLLTRTRSSDDERHLIVRITKQGEALKEKAKSVPEELGKCIDLSPEDAGALYRILYDLLGQM